MYKNVVVFGGGNGMSTLLKGLKLFPINITSVVTTADSGKSTGRLREEFNTPAVGDIRRVLVSLSEMGHELEDVFNYRFNTTSDLDGHALGNLVLTALIEYTGSLNKAIELLSKMLNLKGEVLPLTEDYAVLMAKKSTGKIIENEDEITKAKGRIEKLYYKKEPKINTNVLKKIKKADLIILSMGSLYTSILPNIISKEVINAIDNSNAEIMYINNIVTEPGETDKFNVTDHINTINKYLGKKKVGIVLANNGKIPLKVKNNYFKTEGKEIVKVDKEFLNNTNIKKKVNNYVKIENGMIFHNLDILCLDIYSYLINNY